MKKKLFIILSTLSICVCVLTACGMSIDSGAGTYKGITVTKENPEPEFLEEPTEAELSYFETMEEGIKASEMANCDVSDVERIIKVVEKNDRCDVFFINKKDGKDVLYVYKLRIKTDGGKTLYSDGLYATIIQWQAAKAWIGGIAKRCKETELISQVVFSNLNSDNSDGIFNLGENGGQVRWGLYNKDDIKNLTINGEAPTEIMEITMDGEKVYFWYYENLELPVSEIGNAIIEY